MRTSTNHNLDICLDRRGAVQYLPYGFKKSGGRGVTPFAFTGKPKDEESNLHYFGARYYDQLSRRFITSDPKTYPDVTLVIKNRILNLYVFDNDNPVKFVDPDGEIAILAVFAISAGVGILIDYFSHYAEAHKKTDISLYKYWISGEYPVEREAIVGGFSAATGIVTGGIGSTTLSLGLKIPANAGATVLINKAKSEALGEEFTTGEAFTSGLAGGVAAGVSMPLSGVSKRIVAENTKAAFEAGIKVLGNEDLHKIYLRPVLRKVNAELKKLPERPMTNRYLHLPPQGVPVPAY